MWNWLRQLRHQKVDHVANYILRKGFAEYHESMRKLYASGSYPNVTILKLDKLMYFIEGISYVRLGYGMTESYFTISEYGMRNHRINERFQKMGQFDLISLLHSRYLQKGSNAYPVFLLTPEEMEVLDEIWEAYKHISVWRMIDGMMEDEARIKAVENGQLMLNGLDIKESFLKKIEE